MSSLPSLGVLPRREAHSAKWVPLKRLVRTVSIVVYTRCAGPGGSGGRVFLPHPAGDPPRGVQAWSPGPTPPGCQLRKGRGPAWLVGGRSSNTQPGIWQETSGRKAFREPVSEVMLLYR